MIAVTARCLGWDDESRWVSGKAFGIQLHVEGRNVRISIRNRRPRRLFSGVAADADNAKDFVHVDVKEAISTRLFADDAPSSDGDHVKLDTGEGFPDALIVEREEPG